LSDDKITADVFVNKAEAVRRQINSAIRMYFQAMDDLAIHTVIGAARALARDLNRARGKDVYEMGARYGFITAVQDKIKGKPLPPEVTEFLPEISDEDRELWLSLDPKDPAALGIKGFPTREIWDNSVRAVNFLKHADRDAEALLSVAEVDNLSRLMEAVAWYLQLGFDLSDEMEVLNIYSMAHETNLLDIEQDPKRAMVTQLARMDEPTRREVCLRILRAWDRLQ
jgi:hypothetical protein